jgi:hypothetical protein
VVLALLVCAVQAREEETVAQAADRRRTAQAARNVTVMVTKPRIVHLHTVKTTGAWAWYALPVWASELIDAAALCHPPAYELPRLC